jgi:hypothetical protein
MNKHIPESWHELPQDIVYCVIEEMSAIELRAALKRLDCEELESRNYTRCIEWKRRIKFQLQTMQEEE